MRHLTLISIMLILVATVIVGCGGDNDDAAEDLNVDEILENAAKQWETVETAHFELDIDGETYLDDAGTIQLKDASGDMRRPDAVKAEASISVTLLNVDVSLIFIGGKTYMTDLFTGSWVEAPGDFSYNPAVLLSDDQGLSHVLRSLDNAELQGNQDVDGNDAYHITASVPGDIVASLTANAINDAAVDVEAWIDTDTSNILRVNVAQPGDDEPTVWKISLSDFGKPVEITAPDL